jgi:hypothetical protein
MSGKAFSDMRPQIVQAFFCLVLQYAFINHQNYPWNADRRTTQLVIQTAIAENSRETGIHPAIIVDQGQLSFNNDSIGNKAYLERYKEYLIKETISYTVSGNITMHCIGEAKISAENLAYEVSTFLVTARNSVGKILQLQNLSMPQQSRANPISREGGDTLYDCQVAVNYSYAVSSIVTPVDLGPLLTDVLAQPGIATPVIGGGGIGGTGTGGVSGNWGGDGGLSVTIAKINYLSEDFRDDIISLLNNNCTATLLAPPPANRNAAVRVSTGCSSGKKYFTVKFNTFAGYGGIGLGNSAWAKNSYSSGLIGQECGISIRFDSLYYSTYSQAFWSTFITGDLIGVAVNFDDKVITIYRNGAILATDTGGWASLGLPDDNEISPMLVAPEDGGDSDGLLYPYLELSNIADNFTIDLAPSSCPTGFSVWSSPLPTSTIKDYVDDGQAYLSFSTKSGV